MDKVRLGRALGYGTRHAARTLAAIAEAAAAPDSSAPQHPRAAPTTSRSGNGVPNDAPRPNSASQPAKRADAASTGTAASRPAPNRGFRQSFLRPLAVYSGALWLRVTGVFFAIITFSIGSGAWRLREALHPGAPPPTVQRFWVFAAVALLFAYFTISSFIRANLMERRAASATR